MSAATLAQLGNVPPKNQTATADVLAACARQGITVTQVWGVGGGDHADGYATDFMVYGDQAAGDWIADYVWANRDRLGVRWQIWRQRIRSTTMPSNSYGPGLVWNAMPDRGSPTANHQDHVHVKWNMAPVRPAPTPAPPRPAPTRARPRLRLANVQPLPGHATPIGRSNDDVVLLNRLLWDAQGPAYRRDHQAAWMKESARLYGRMTEQVVFDTYAALHRGDPKRWGPPPSRPAWPGRELIEFLGADPI